MRGTVRKITLPRRLVADLMHASIRVPFVSLARPLHIRALQEARAQAALRPGWAAIFVKAFALVAKEEPILRTLYVKWPMPAFYELPRSVAMVAIARVEDGQDCVLPQKVTLEVTDTEPTTKGQTASSSYKPATLSNGVRTNVPPFIGPGTRIVVMTEDGSYVERAKE